MATTEEIRSDLADIVNEVAGVDADDVQLDKSFVDDLDVDSLSMVEVVVAAEEKFSVRIPDDAVKEQLVDSHVLAKGEAPRETDDAVILERWREHMDWLSMRAAWCAPAGRSCCARGSRRSTAPATRRAPWCSRSASASS